MRTVSSHEPLAIRFFPSEDASVIQLVCPSNVLTHSPVSFCQIRIVLSSEALAKRPFPREQRPEMVFASCPVSIRTRGRPRRKWVRWFPLWVSQSAAWQALLQYFLNSHEHWKRAVAAQLPQEREEAGEAIWKERARGKNVGRQQQQTTTTPRPFRQNEEGLQFFGRQRV